MASTTPDLQYVIYEAAESPKLPKVPNIFMLKAFLTSRGVDFNLHTHDEWLQMYDQAWAHLQEIKDGAEQLRLSQDKPGQIAGEKVPEWPSKIDSSRRDDAEIDSAYQSDGTDQSNLPLCVYALVPALVDIFPDGLAAVCCSFSDTDSENYILEPICKRLKLQAGPDKTVSLTFCWKYSGPSEMRKFKVRPLEDLEVKSDIRFGMKPTEERTESNTEGDATDEGIGEEVQDNELSALIKRRPSSIDLNKDDVAKILGTAIGVGCAQFNNGDNTKLGQDIRKTMEAVMGGKFARQSIP